MAFLRSFGASLALAFCAVAASAQSQPPIRIAHIDTFSGPTASTGVTVSKTLLYAVDMINARGGVLGRKLEVVQLDNAGDPAKAISMLNSTIDQKINFMVQAGNSGIAAALLGAVEKHNARNPDARVLYLNYGSALPELTGEKCNTIRLFAEGLSGTVEAEGQDRGVIVNTASVAAYEALSAQTAYGSSKAGVASMTLPLARELARYGIRVMALAPGTFETGMYELVPAHTRRTLIDDVPFPPRPGRPEEFAHMVQALIENGMMNGSVVRIDGAVRMREPAPRDAAESATR